MRSISNVTLGLIFALTTIGCVEEYDPPPEATLVQPEGGAFAVGETLNLTFTEPIEPDTLVLNIWPDERDVENELLADAEPLVESCTPEKGECGDLTLTLAEDRTSATLELDPEGIGKAGVPMLLELSRGLTDNAGRKTGTNHIWAFQFRKEAEENTEPVEFDDGVYIFVSTIEQPLPTVLTLISDVQASEDGTFALAGAEGDELGDAPQNTKDPEKLEVDTTEQGWTAHAVGTITLDEDGKRFIETDPFDVEIGLGGALGLELTGTRLIGEVTKNEEGKDRIEATLSVETFTLVNGEKRVDYDGQSNALFADLVAEELAPEGHPTVCDDPCGAAGGTCNPPEDFPPSAVCEE